MTTTKAATRESEDEATTTTSSRRRRSSGTKASESEYEATTTKASQHKTASGTKESDYDYETTTKSSRRRHSSGTKASEQETTTKSSRRRTAKASKHEATTTESASGTWEEERETSGSGTEESDYETTTKSGREEDYETTTKSSRRRRSSGTKEQEAKYETTTKAAKSSGRRRHGSATTTETFSGTWRTTTKKPSTTARENSETTVAVPSKRGGGGETETETETERETYVAPTETETYVPPPPPPVETETYVPPPPPPPVETETYYYAPPPPPPPVETETYYYAPPPPPPPVETETYYYAPPPPPPPTETYVPPPPPVIVQQPPPPPPPAPPAPQQSTGQVALCTVRIDDNIIKVMYNGQDITNTLSPSWALTAWYEPVQFQVNYVPGATLIVYGNDNGGGSIPHQTGFSIVCSGPLSSVSNMQAWSAYGSKNALDDYDEHFQGKGDGWSSVIDAYSGQVNNAQPMWGQANFGYQVFLWSEPAQPATCQVRIDDNILAIEYNGQDYTNSLQPPGANDDWWVVQSFTVDYEPGAALVVYGNDNGGGQTLAQCGFSISCTGALSLVNDNSAWAAYGSKSPISPYDPHYIGNGDGWNTPIDAYSGGRVPGTQPMWPAQYMGYAAFRWDEVSVTCKLEFDDHLVAASYNGQDYTQWLSSVNSDNGGSQYYLTVPYIPGAYLVVYGYDEGGGTINSQCGFSISCPTNSPLAGTSDLSAWAAYGSTYPLSSYDQHLTGAGAGWTSVTTASTGWRVDGTQPMWSPSPVGYVAFRWQG